MAQLKGCVQADLVKFQLTNFCKGSPGAKTALVEAELHKTVIHFVTLILVTGNQVSC